MCELKCAECNQANVLVDINFIVPFLHICAEQAVPDRDGLCFILACGIKWQQNIVSPQRNPCEVQERDGRIGTEKGVGGGEREERGGRRRMYPQPSCRVSKMVLVPLRKKRDRANKQ